MQIVLDYIQDFFARLTQTEWIWLIVLGCACLIQCVYWWVIYTYLPRFSRKIKKGKITFTQATPPVSVVICARNERYNLERFLPLILEQDYPEFEVVVVDDGSTDDTNDYLTVLKTQYEHLRTTFVPNEAKFINSKKFALTLGIKATKHELLVLTDADCKPLSNQWLRKIVRNFDKDTDVVLGYGTYKKTKGLLNHLIVFDTLMIAIQYFNYALCGVPYMGVGRNLAYRKSTFTKNQGFTSHLNILSGDDDLFVNKVATKQNTRIEIAPESHTESVPEETFRNWIRQKRRHLSTATLYNFKSKALLGLESLSRGVFYIALVGALIVGEWQLQSLAAGIFLIRYISQYIVINVSAKKLNERRFYTGILLFDLILPLISLHLMLTGGKQKSSSW
ncbi:MAG: glycosyltransferase [Paludibacteraceae bacterium]|nr:glycosyltransferase [Paludibacteraceae bacterium]